MTNELQLQSFIERIERLQEEKDNISKDIREVFAEAKNIGYDTKAMRAVIKLRKMSATDREEQDCLIETYKQALGL